MINNWLVWHRVSNVHYTTQVLDLFLHVVKVGNKWFLRYNDVLYFGAEDMDKAFEYAEGFALGLKDKRKKDDAEREVNEN